MALMAVAALPQLGGSEDGETPGLANEIITYIALFTVAVGTGGIKPCVSALGGDQEGFQVLTYSSDELFSPWIPGIFMKT